MNPLCVANVKSKYTEPPSIVPILASTLVLTKTYKNTTQEQGYCEGVLPYTCYTVASDAVEC
jgi:hypothetical protein